MRNEYLRALEFEWAIGPRSGRGGKGFFALDFELVVEFFSFPLLPPFFRKALFFLFFFFCRVQSYLYSDVISPPSPYDNCYILPFHFFFTFSGLLTIHPSLSPPRTHTPNRHTDKNIV